MSIRIERSIVIETYEGMPQPDKSVDLHKKV